MVTAPGWRPLERSGDGMDPFWAGSAGPRAVHPAHVRQDLSYKAQQSCPTRLLSCRPYIEVELRGLQPSRKPKELSMIQLASDPTASRMSFRPTRSEGEAKESKLETRQGRTGHAWPFPSRYANRPAGQDGQKSKPSESGS